MSGTTTTTFNSPQSLYSRTDPSPDLRSSSPVAPSPLSSTRSEPWGYESPSGEFYGRICSVIGLYDFFSSDADRLSFRKHEILEIVRQDESGWWGAVRKDGSEIGWIPAKFVRALSDNAGYRVHEIREKSRMPEFATETDRVRSAPPLSRRIVEALSSGTAVPDNEPSDITQVSPRTSGWFDSSIATEPTCDLTTPEELVRNPPPPNVESHEYEIEESPTLTVSTTVVPPTSKGIQPLRVDKSLPASPDGTTAPNSASIEHKISAHRRNSSDSAVNLPDSPSGSSTITRAQTSDQLSSLVSFLDLPLSPIPCPIPHNARPRPGKVLQLTGDDSAQAFHNAKQAQANLPWFLRHRYGEEEIKLEFDGTVKAGTLPALVEHLVVNPLRENRFSAP
jgi:son of sevenless-like protein